MNVGLTDENYEALSQYRLQRAHETLAEIPFYKNRGTLILPLTVYIMHAIMLL